MRQTITVTVAPDGSVSVETAGYKGSSCKQASEFIEKALGAKTGETLKPEYYQQSTENRLKSGN